MFLSRILADGRHEVRIALNKIIIRLLLKRRGGRDLEEMGGGGGKAFGEEKSFLKLASLSPAIVAS